MRKQMGNAWFRNTDDKEREDQLRYAQAMTVANEARNRMMLEAAQDAYMLAHQSFTDSQRLRKQVQSVLQKHKIKFPSSVELETPEVLTVHADTESQAAMDEEARKLADNARQLLRNKFIGSLMNMSRTRGQSQKLQPTQFPTFRKNALGEYARGINTYVKDSDMPMSGKGLFAARHLTKGSIIEFFDGKLISKEEAQQLEEMGAASHVVTLEIAGWHLDCRSTPAEAVELMLGASFANASSTHVNALLERSADRKEPRTPFAYLVAARDIQKDEEILFNYKPL